MATKMTATEENATDENERYVQSIYPNAKCHPYYDDMYKIVGILTIVGYRVILDEKDELQNPEGQSRGYSVTQKTEEAAWEHAAQRVNKEFLKTLKN
jgi:hypothetical protein